MHEAGRTGPRHPASLTGVTQCGGDWIMAGLPKYRGAKHREQHATQRLGWLRAAVLGANDGILSTASLMIGVASARGGPAGVLVAGLSGLVAGAMSMAAGEYVSVSSQADSEAADLSREQRELATDWPSEVGELAAIYVERGLEPPLARQVAESLMRHDALQAHSRDELGLSDATAARPIQAALASAGAFASGAIMPVAAAVFSPAQAVAWSIPLVSLCALGGLGIVGARAGGARPVPAAIRVTFWGVTAMAVTAAIGHLFAIRS
ncbi:nodulin-related integral membrane protein [Gluconacetobacter azotocaptans DSM 13594]|nr:nodulin-related integral membrane protein [Gluconacetobacter azotocaptans DSM 13594]